MQSSSQIIITNKPTPSFLQAGCPSCRLINSVRGLKGNVLHFMDLLIQAHLSLPTVYLTTKDSWLLLEGYKASCQPSDTSTAVMDINDGYFVISSQKAFTDLFNFCTDFCSAHWFCIFYCLGETISWNLVNYCSQFSISQCIMCNWFRWLYWHQRADERHSKTPPR